MPKCIDGEVLRYYLISVPIEMILTSMKRI